MTVLRSLMLCLPLLATVWLLPEPLWSQEGKGTDKATPSAKIENSRTGVTLELAELLDELSGSDVIFMGENHDNDSGHEFQMQVIEGLVNAGHSIAISMEQFERDVQGALNDYLSGRIIEDEFLKASRPWSNYQKHYRPVIEFAKENRVDVIASNVPRRMASKVSQGERPAVEDQVFLPRKRFTDKDAYWDRFEQSMAGHGGTDMDSMMELYFESQCLKDDAMAESISDFLAVHSHRRTIVIHLCGSFHSDYGLGTVSRLLKRRPLTRVSVLTMEATENEDEKEVRAELRERSHFTFWTIENESDEEPTEESDATS
ncbi:MAG: ChaN family lipoprotein [Planctomycetota bacterium]